MALTVGSVVAEFKSDLSDFKKGLMDVKAEVNNFGDQVQNVGRTAMKVGGVMSLALTLPIVGLGSAAAKAASDFEQSQVAFATMLGSEEKAVKMLNDITAMAMKTPFQIKDVETGAKQLLAYGVSADDVLSRLSMLGDIASGVGMDKLPNLILAFGQVSAATRLTGMELRQFTEAGVPMLDTLSKNLKKPVSEIQQMVSEGKIKFKDVEDALRSLTGEGGRFQDLMQKQSKTTAGQISNLQDNVTKLARAFGKELLPTINQVVTFLNNMLTAFQKLDPGTRKTIVTVLAVVAALGPVILIIGSLINAIGLIIGAISAAGPVLAGLGAAIGAVSLPVLAVIAGIAALIAIGYLLWQNWDMISVKATELFNTISTAVSNFYNTYIMPIFTAIGAAFTWLYEVAIKPMIDNIVSYFQLWASVITWVWENMIYPILYLMEAVFLYVFDAIYTWIHDRLQQAYDFIVFIFTTLWAWIQPYLMALAAFLAQVWNTILAVVKQIWGFIRDSIIAPIIAAKDKVVEVVTGIYNSLVEKFNAALTFVRDVWGKIKDAIVKPFEEAKAAVERIAQQIKEAADKINPFHRESPSLVDNVRAGVKAIEDAYAGLGMNLNGPSIAQAGIGVGNGGNIVNISLAGANITDPSIAEDYAEIIGDKIIDKLTRSVRT